MQKKTWIGFAEMRRRYRDAEGVEGVGIGEGVPLHSRLAWTRGLGKRREFPQPGPANAFSVLFESHRILYVKENAILLLITILTRNSAIADKPRDAFRSNLRKIP